MKRLVMLIIMCLTGHLTVEAVVETMDYVDLNRYLGKWYEIALLPNWFERKCVEGAVAEYSLLENGMIRVVNRCKTKKGLSEATGVAWVVDKQTQAKLKVSFVPFAKIFKWFGGDYWILYIDPGYQFAVVGAPSLKYLWLLARTKQVSQKIYGKFLEIATENGFDTSQIIRVR